VLKGEHGEHGCHLVRVQGCLWFTGLGCIKQALSNLSKITFITLFNLYIPSSGAKAFLLEAGFLKTAVYVTRKY
jgi:hypothetical protein